MSVDSGSSLRPVIDQWLISQQMPFLRHLRKQARLDMLNGLNQEHIRVLEKYFGTQVIVEKLNSHIVKNIEAKISDEIELCQIKTSAISVFSETLIPSI